jgi:hypothetical protein
MSYRPTRYSPVNVEPHPKSTFQVRLEDRTSDDRYGDSVFTKHGLSSAMEEVARWANRDGANYRVVVRVPAGWYEAASRAVAQFNANAQPPCTVVVGCVPEVARCGAPSVHTWKSITDGAVLAERAAHERR